MCTMIGTRLRISGAARSSSGWVPVESATVTLDHATRVWSEHALRVDLSGPAGTVPAAFELDLASAKALLAGIEEALAAAGRAGVTE